MSPRLLALAFVVPALAATPALAKPSPNSAALDAHFNSLSNADSDACFEFDAYTAQQRIERCQAALDTLAKARKAKKKPSKGEAANFDYEQVTLQSGLGAAYAEIDRSLSARVCTLMESNGTIRYRLSKLPESEVSAKAYQTYQNPPKEYNEIMQACRQKHGTPKGAAPIPE